MSDNFVQFASRGANADTTTTTVTLNGVVAGNSIVAFLMDGSSFNPATHTVADGQGSYTAGATAQEVANVVFGQVFTLVNANAGTHTITGTVTTGDTCWIVAVEVGTTLGATALSGTNASAQNSPGTTANALVTGTITVTGAATIVAFSADTNSVATANEPVVGTAPFVFVSRDNNASTVMGAYRLETAPGAANGSATATAVTGTDNFVTLGAAILNGTAPPLNTPMMGQVCL